MQTDYKAFCSVTHWEPISSRRFVVCIVHCWRQYNICLWQNLLPMFPTTAPSFLTIILPYKTIVTYFPYVNSEAQDLCSQTEDWSEASEHKCPLIVYLIVIQVLFFLLNHTWNNQLIHILFSFSQLNSPKSIISVSLLVHLNHKHFNPKPWILQEVNDYF